MSSGGRRGIDISGVNTMRSQNASDVIEQKKVKLVYQTFASTTGANAYVNQTPNGNDSLLQFVKGVKDCSSGCTGLDYDFKILRQYRS